MQFSVAAVSFFFLPDVSHVQKLREGCISLIFVCEKTHMASQESQNDSVQSFFFWSVCFWLVRNLVWHLHS